MHSCYNFVLVLHQNALVLSQSEAHNFFTYIITSKIVFVCKWQYRCWNTHVRCSLWIKDACWWHSNIEQKWLKFLSGSSSLWVHLRGIVSPRWYSSLLLLIAWCSLSTPLAPICWPLHTLAPCLGSPCHVIKSQTWVLLCLDLDIDN